MIGAWLSRLVGTKFTDGDRPVKTALRHFIHYDSCCLQGEASALYLDQVRAGYREDWENGGRDDLDFLVIEKAMERAEQQMNITFESVRGAFIEFGPLYRNS